MNEQIMYTLIKTTVNEIVCMKSGEILLYGNLKKKRLDLQFN